MARIAIIGSVASSLVNFRGSLIETLVSRGHAVHCIAAHFDAKTREQLEKIGAVCHAVDFDRQGLNPANDFKSLVQIYSILSKIEPDALVTYTIKPVVYGSIAAYLAGVRNVYSLITGLGIPFSRSGVRGLFVRSIAEGLYELGLNFNTRIFFQNADDRREFVQRRVVEWDRTCVVDGSGVDLNHFRHEPLPSGISFLLISRLLDEKGVRLYAEAARRVHARHPDVTFSLAGPPGGGPSGIDSSTVCRWSRQGFLNYLGILSDVRPALAAHSVFVLPSYYREGVPRTTLEALATGRAVITTDSPGCRETVEDDMNGYLIEPRSVDALEDAMERLIASPWLIERFADESRRLAEQRFDVDRINRDMLEAMDL